MNKISLNYKRKLRKYANKNWILTNSLKLEGPWQDSVNMIFHRKPMELLKMLKLYERRNTQTTTDEMEQMILQFYTLNEMWILLVSHSNSNLKQIIALHDFNL